MSRFCQAALVALLALPGLISAQPQKVETPRSPLVKLSIYPARIELNGPRDEQRIGVVGEYAEGRSWELTRNSSFTSANPKIAEVDAAGIVRPVGDGETTIEIHAGTMKQTIPVRVTKATADISVG